MAIVSYGDDQPPSGSQLLEEGLRNARRCRSHQDDIERSFFRPAGASVPRAQNHVHQAEVGESSPGSLRQLGHRLDGVDATGELREEGRRSACTAGREIVCPWSSGSAVSS